MFKAADGQSGQVREGGLGMEVLLHLEEFSSWPQWLSPGEQVFLLKANDAWGTYQMVSFFNCGPKRGLSWARTAISQKR